MKKHFRLFNLLMALIASGAICSCSKKSDAVTTTSGSVSAQYTLNGTTYTASTPIKVSSGSQAVNYAYFPPVAANGSYIAVIENVNPKDYAFAFVQKNIVAKGDTASVILYLPRPPLVVGTYKIIYPSTVSSTGSDFIAFYSRSLSSFSSTSATGTVVITSIDAVNKTVSGSYIFQLTDAIHGSSVTITNGQINAAAYQTI